MDTTVVFGIAGYGVEYYLMEYWYNSTVMFMDGEYLNLSALPDRLWL